MKYKGHKITVEKINGWVWTIELPDGSTLSPEEGAQLYDKLSDVVEAAKEVIDELPPTTKIIEYED